MYKILNFKGSTLQAFNNELVKSLENIRERRDMILIDIRKEEERKIEIENYLAKLKAELEQIDGIWKII
jgi:hypothetical protein